MHVKKDKPDHYDQYVLLHQILEIIYPFHLMYLSVGSRLSLNTLARSHAHAHPCSPPPVRLYLSS